ncbi:CidA/LrgA family protein [Salmonella enterica]|nr:CidA/LrgA family protein [Salmonella enterica]
MLYAGLFIFSQYLVSWLHLPLPANLVGMVLMLALIVCRIIPLSWVRAGARWLLAEMLLFFVPAVVAVVNYAHLLLVDGWRIFSVIAISTLMVLGATATVVAVTSSVWLARLFTLSDEIQRSLAVRSVTTPFALAAAEPLGGQPDLVALFVVVTGVFGMAVGDALFLRLSIREGMAKGAGFGAASHGAGTARSYELGQQEGVVASLVMMLSGVVMVLAAPLVARVMF